jgi:hypothetical protein
MQKTLDKIDQLIDLNTTMGRNLAANKLKEIKDEIVGMYSEEDMKLAFETGRNFQLTGENNFNELVKRI